MFTWICVISHTHYVLLLYSRAGCALPVRAGQGWTSLVASCSCSFGNAAAVQGWLNAVTPLSPYPNTTAANNREGLLLNPFSPNMFSRMSGFHFACSSSSCSALPNCSKAQGSDYYALWPWDGQRRNTVKNCKARERFSLLASPCPSQHLHDQGLPSTMLLCHSTSVHTKNALMKQI